MTDEQLLESINQIVASQLNAKLEPINKELQAHGKTLKYLIGTVNKIDKLVDIIGRRYDERIVKNTKEIDNIKEHLNIHTKH